MKSKLKQAQLKAFELKQTVNSLEIQFDDLHRDFMSYLRSYLLTANDLKTYRIAHEKACQEVLKLQGKRKK